VFDGDDTPYGIIELDLVVLDGGSLVSGAESDGTLQVNYTSTVDISGFQFDVSGVTVTGASSDTFDASGFDDTVLGFSFMGDVIPAGSGTLVTVYFSPEGLGSTACMINELISASGGNQIASTITDDCDDVPAAVLGAPYMVVATGGYQHVMVSFAPVAFAASYNVYRDGELISESYIGADFNGDGLIDFVDDGSTDIDPSFGLNNQADYCYTVSTNNIEDVEGPSSDSDCATTLPLYCV
jgi:hypothetical protein